MQAIRGMNDLWPEETPVWRYVENTMQNILRQYNFHEIRTPVLEPTQLFQRSVGEHTDIVEKEMYTFDDRNGDSLSLRPELTAGIVRAGIQHGFLYNQVKRLWSINSVFRHERPQKGRYRQFHQLSVESFGMSGAQADAELILLSARLWKTLGIEKHLTLELNTLGTGEERIAYRNALVDYFSQHINSLDEDSKRRLTTNPLRILDSKDSKTKKIIEDAPKMHDYIGMKTQQEFTTLLAILDDNNINYTVNQTLVRGLDYYCKTVFEWTTVVLGSQGTVCGGGRYDPLVEMLGGKPTSACGFGLGIERLILLLETTGNIPASINNDADLSLVATNDAEIYAMALAEKVRNQLPDCKFQANFGGSFKSQMKRANRSGATLALIVEKSKAENNQITLKYLREDKPQQTDSEASIIALAGKLLAEKKSPKA